MIFDAPDYVLWQICIGKMFLLYGLVNTVYDRIAYKIKRGNSNEYTFKYIHVFLSITYRSNLSNANNILTHC